MQGSSGRFSRMVTGAVYIALFTLSYYSCCYRLPVGVKYAINLVIVAWAALSFMLRPRMEDMKYCARFLVLFCVSYLIPWVWSLLVWIYELKSIDYIMRGSLNIFYMLTGVACVCASFYLLKEKAVGYMLIAMAIANGLVFIEVGQKNGFDLLFSEYVELVISFAGTTGEVVHKMELHDMVFGWGALILYYAMRPTKRRWQRWVFLLISVFFFTLAFKRIGVAAVLAALVIGLLYQRLSEKGKRYALGIGAVALIAGAMFYIYLVKSGLFYDIADAMGVNLMGRKAIYSAYESHYSLSPFFVGHGVRYVYQYGTTVNGVDALHNDLLSLYIEVGMCVWFIWMFYQFYMRAGRMGRRYGMQATTNLVVGSVYLFITHMTDNSFYQYPINIVCYLTAIAWCHIEQKPDETEAVNAPSFLKNQKGGNRHAYSDYSQLSHHVSAHQPLL